MGFISGEGSVRASPFLTEMQYQSNSASLPHYLKISADDKLIFFPNFPRKQDLTLPANCLLHEMSKQVL